MIRSLSEFETGLTGCAGRAQHSRRQGVVLQCPGRGPARRPAQAVVRRLVAAMAWNANDASRQAAEKGLQQQQRFYRNNQQRATRQMSDLMAQYRARRGFSRQQRGGQGAAMGAGIPAFEPGYSSEPILDISAHEAQGDGLLVILPVGFDAIVGQAWPAATTLAAGWPASGPARSARPLPRHRASQTRIPGTGPRARRSVQFRVEVPPERQHFV